MFSYNHHLDLSMFNHAAIVLIPRVAEVVNKNNLGLLILLIVALRLFSKS